MVSALAPARCRRTRQASRPPPPVAPKWAFSSAGLVALVVGPPKTIYQNSCQSSCPCDGGPSLRTIRSSASTTNQDGATMTARAGHVQKPTHGLAPELRSPTIVDTGGGASVELTPSVRGYEHRRQIAPGLVAPGGFTPPPPPFSSLQTITFRLTQSLG